MVELLGSLKEELEVVDCVEEEEGEYCEQVEECRSVLEWLLLLHMTDLEERDDNWRWWELVQCQAAPHTLGTRDTLHQGNQQQQQGQGSQEQGQVEELV